MAEIIPAIIPESLDNLKENLESIKGLTKRVQVDIIDGIFAPSKSWPFNDANGELNQLLEKDEKLLYSQDFIIEVDMMIDKPEIFIDDWIRLGAKTFIIHLGSTKIIEDIISKIRSANLEIGIAIAPSSPIDKLLPYMDKIDFVQFMGNDKIGYHGVKLDDRVINKIKSLREIYPNAIISVDIGVNFKTAPRLIDAGANKLVSGSAIFESTDMVNAIEKLGNN